MTRFRVRNRSMTFYSLSIQLNKTIICSFTDISRDSSIRIENFISLFSPMITSIISFPRHLVRFFLNFQIKHLTIQTTTPRSKVFLTVSFLSLYQPNVSQKFLYLRMQKIHHVNEKTISILIETLNIIEIMSNKFYIILLLLEIHQYIVLLYSIFDF